MRWRGGLIMGALRYFFTCDRRLPTAHFLNLSTVCPENRYVLEFSNGSVAQLVEHRAGIATAQARFLPEDDVVVRFSSQ